MNRRSTCGALLSLFASFVLPAPSSAQHEMHGMRMDGGWRMVPMDMNMPMLPGLESAVPVVGPYMPGMGMDPGMLPEARPSELVPLAAHRGQHNDEILAALGRSPDQIADLRDRGVIG